ncbi:MAG: hypothetical protein OSB05_03330 [Akkermansiaceae bacterium]|nr:hypothetical protein [Akkermansiaceae bacterium]
MKSTMNKVTKSIKSMSTVDVKRLKNIRFPGFKDDTPPILKVRKGDLKKRKPTERKILA